MKKKILYAAIILAALILLIVSYFMGALVFRIVFFVCFCALLIAAIARLLLLKKKSIVVVTAYILIICLSAALLALEIGVRDTMAPKIKEDTIAYGFNALMASDSFKNYQGGEFYCDGIEGHFVLIQEDEFSLAYDDSDFFVADDYVGRMFEQRKTEGKDGTVQYSCSSVVTERGQALSDLGEVIETYAFINAEDEQANRILITYYYTATWPAVLGWMEYIAPVESLFRPTLDFTTITVREIEAN